MKRPVVALVASMIALLALRGDAQQDASSRPRYERPVQPGGRGGNRLTIDWWAVAVGQPFAVVSAGGAETDRARAVVAAGGLGDLRLFDAANRAVPYLLVPPAQPVPTWISGDMLPLVATKKTSGFEVALARPMLVDRIRLDGLPARFLKRATLEGSGDRERWTALAPQATVFDLPDDQLKQLVIAFPPGEMRYLRVTWDDRSSARLPLPQSVAIRQATTMPAPEPLQVPLEVEKRPSEPGRSRYRVTFPAAHMPVTDLEVIANDKNILRQARVTEPQLSGDQLLPRQLGASTLRRASREEDDAVAADLRIPVAVPSSSRVDLTIEDGSNPSLELTGVTALLAPLPWIYFESPDGAPLTARLGDRKASAPAYDLEAMRPNLPKIKTVDAAWGPIPSSEPSTSSSPALESEDTHTPGAPLDVSEFRYSRDVPASPKGLTTLTLDAAALAHSQLTDIRLVDRDGRQRAYILETRDEPLTIALGDKLKPGQAPDWMHDHLTNAPSGNRTIYRLSVPYEAMPASKLVLTTGTRVFSRQVAAFVKWEPEGGRDRPGARRVASATWAHAEPEEPPPHLTFELPAMQTADLVLLVDEGDNAPLPIESVRLLLPGYQIRFLRTDTVPLTLFYGDPTVSAPRYDLALLTPYLVDAPAGEIAPGPERERTPATSAARLPSWGFWAILVAAVLVLLVLIVRLLRAETAGAEQHPSEGQGA
jgi:Protein of unknown function (DUF3999)